MDNEALAEKAAQYAAEPERFSFCALKMEMQSEHGTRTLFYVAGQWKCNCDFFKQRQTCSHTMAAEQLLMVRDLPMKHPFGSLVGASGQKEGS